MSLGQSLDLPSLDRVDTLAQELALLQDKGKRRIAILGSRHVPVVAILPQSLDRQAVEIRDLLERVLHLVEKPEQDELPLPIASSLCNQEIISRCDQLICLAFHDSETLLASARTAEDMGKVVSLLYFD